jgi:gluconokinase
MNYYLGVDIGTTSVKAVAFSETGEMIAKQNIGYNLYHPKANYSEQDPEEIFDAVVEGINNVVSDLSPAVPLLVSFSSVMHCLIAVNSEGKPLTNCMIWADNRASDIADALRNSERGRSFYHTTGVPVHAMSPLCKLLWLKENEPKIFGEAHRFIGIKEYVFYQLFNQYTVDTGIASTTGLLDIKSLKWNTRVLDYIGIDIEKLSEITDVKTAFYYTAKNGRLKLGAQTPVFIGSSDGALANLGTGAINNQSMAVTIGTSSAARIVLEQPATDRHMRTFCYHVKDNYYIAGGASNNGAVIMQWLRESLLQTEESLEDLFQLAESVPAGSNDLLFLPFILGERAPIWNSHAKGNFFGFTINHTKAHLVRASMEGIVYCLYSIGKILQEKEEVVKVCASGGFALSTLWLQIVADIFNKKVCVTDASEGSALGAVMLGIEATNRPLIENKENEVIYQPNPLAHEQYSKQFQRFERIYEKIKTEFVASESCDLVQVL